MQGTVLRIIPKDGNFNDAVDDYVDNDDDTGHRISVKMLTQVKPIL